MIGGQVFWMERLDSHMGFQTRLAASLKFKTMDKLVHWIGLDQDGSWSAYGLAKHGYIYRVPCYSEERRVLKTNSNGGTTETSLSIDGFWALRENEDDFAFCHIGILDLKYQWFQSKLARIEGQYVSSC